VHHASQIADCDLRSNDHHFALVAQCYQRIDERQRRGLLDLLADPFTFRATDPASATQIVVGRGDAADMLILMQHEGADSILTSIDEFLGRQNAVGAVGNVARAFHDRAKPELRAFAHVWNLDSDALRSVLVPSLGRFS
jgi:hypothetical protein